MSDSPPTKLEEQATAKADLSYSYWQANAAKAKTSSSPAPEPKKLSEEEARALQEQQRAASGSGTSTSAWNAAGTFEERDVTEWAKGAVKQALANVKGPKARITAVTTVAGHANIWFIRGSKRAGFEFDMDLTWAAGDGDEEVTGTMRLVGASPDDLDDLEPSEVKVLDKKDGRGAAEPAAVKEAKGLAEGIRKALRSFYNEELKQR